MAVPNATTIFLILFITTFLSLGVTEMVYANKPGESYGKMFFGLLYLIAAILLIFYKFKNP